MQDLLQAHQAFAFALGHSLYRNAGPGGDHLRDVLFGHKIAPGQFGFLPFGALFLYFRAHLMLTVAQPRGAFILLMVDGLLLFAQDGIQPLLLLL